MSSGEQATASQYNNLRDDVLSTSSGHLHDGSTGRNHGNFVIGLGAAGTDYTLTFNGETNDGVITWMEDEDYFQFSDDILLSTTEKLQLRDTAIYLYSSADGQADLVADTTIQVTAPTVNIEASTAITLESDSITFGEAGDTDIVLNFNANTADGVITWMEDEDYFKYSDDILMNSTEKILFGDTATFIHQSSDGVMTIDGEATIDLNASTAVLVSNDLKLNSDSAVLGFGADNDTTLTHTDGTGLTLNSTNKLTFGDTGTFIHQSSDGVLTITSDTTVDINGAVEFDGAITGATDITLSGELDAATLDLSSSADIAGDLVLSGGADGALQFTNAGENSIKIPDNQASALIIEEADNAYITFVTTNSSEAITVAKATTFSAGIANAGTIDAGTWNGTAIASAYLDSDTAHLSTTQTFTGAKTFTNTVTVGVDDAGHDVKFFGNTASAYMLWDTSADDLILAGAAGIDVDGTTNLDAVDIDGNVQLDGTFTVGVDDTGKDVKFFGATSGAYTLWDESENEFILAGAARMGIGTTNTNMIFNIEDGAGGSDYVRLGGSTTTTGNMAYITRDKASGSTNSPVVRLRQNNSGDDQDTLLVEQDGSGNIITLKDGGSEAFAVEDGGDVTGTHGTYHDSSDVRLKENITTIPNALNKVESLRGVNFTWKDTERKGSNLRMGFIAQEVEEVIPEVVHTQDDERKTKAVEYQYITGLLVEAVKELSNKVKELESNNG